MADANNSLHFFPNVLDSMANFTSLPQLIGFLAHHLLVLPNQMRLCFSPNS
jgi:hypothetical protein